MIAIQQLRKAFGGVQAAADVSFSVPNGAVTGLLGPNGAGKTTVIRAIAGLLTPDDGAVLVDAIDVRRDPTSARRALGILPDSPGCYERLTVAEHIGYSAELHGVSPSQAARRVREVLAQVGLADLRDRRTGQLSSGERRRMRLGCALVHDPRNLILDEPTNGLDVMSARALRREVRRFADSGRAVLFCSHVMPEVTAACDRVVVLKAGRVAAQGTPAELITRTGCASLEDAFVAIIGSDEGLQ